MESPVRKKYVAKCRRRSKKVNPSDDPPAETPNHSNTSVPRPVSHRSREKLDYWSGLPVQPLPGRQVSVGVTFFFAPLYFAVSKWWSSLVAYCLLWVATFGWSHLFVSWNPHRFVNAIEDGDTSYTRNTAIVIIAGISFRVWIYHNAETVAYFLNHLRHR